MSKTLKLKEEAPAVQAFTEAQLVEMLGKIQSEKPLDPLPTALVADKSILPPVDERSAAPVQAPAKIHGRFDINGIPVFAPGVQPSNINPATGSPFNQVMPQPKGGMISPPPTRNFR